MVTRTLIDRTRRHKKPIAAVGGAGAGALAVGGVGLAVTAAAVVAAIYFLERARKAREKLL